MMTNALKTEIIAKCPELLPGRDLAAIAQAVSSGRVRSTDATIGNGSILESIGLGSGTALLDAIHATPAMKYVIPLLDQGRLKIGSDLVQAAIQGFANAHVITQEEADKLKALGKEPNPVSERDVMLALVDDSGNWTV